MKVLVRTYGCQMNDRDSEALAVLLRENGHEITASETDADAIVVNTCSVRDKAEQKALGKLRLLTASKQRHPGLVVGVVGCMAQRLGLEMLSLVDGLDFVLGTRRLWSLPAVLARVAGGEGPVVDVSEEWSGEPPCGHERNIVTAMVTAMRGCDRACAYCVVPAVRGGETSRRIAAIVAEVEDLVSHGTRDVTLIGQSITSYGRSGDALDGGAPESRLGLREPFPRLLEAVAGVRGLARLRFASSHPSGCTDELATAMSSLPVVCEHLHLPVQSGSDRILRKMGRGYAVGQYKQAVARLRSAVPGLAITTDMIVGFPSETEEDFELTRRLMEETGFDNAFMFKYSPRPGTVAASWADDVPDAEKARRHRVLLEDQERRGLGINERLVGKTVEVLLEGPSPRNRKRWTGRTRTNKIAIIADAAGATAGELADVFVEAARPQTLHGKIARRAETQGSRPCAAGCCGQFACEEG